MGSDVEAGNANFVKVEETENTVILWTVILKPIADQSTWVGRKSSGTARRAVAAVGRAYALRHGRHS